MKPKLKTLLSFPLLLWLLAIAAVRTLILGKSAEEQISDGESETLKTGDRWGAYWKHADGWMRLYPPAPRSGQVSRCRD